MNRSSVRIGGRRIFRFLQGRFAPGAAALPAHAAGGDFGRSCRSGGVVMRETLAYLSFGAAITQAEAESFLRRGSHGGGSGHRDLPSVSCQS